MANAHKKLAQEYVVDKVAKSDFKSVTAFHPACLQAPLDPKAFSSDPRVRNLALADRILTKAQYVGRLSVGTGLLTDLLIGDKNT